MFFVEVNNAQTFEQAKTSLVNTCHLPSLLISKERVQRFVCNSGQFHCMVSWSLSETIRATWAGVRVRLHFQANYASQAATQTTPPL
jgi:hypothetical protein